MQRPLAFGMSPARPPGCIPINSPEPPFHVLPLKAATLSPPLLHHRQQEREPVSLLEQPTQQNWSASGLPKLELGEVSPIVPSELGRIFLEKSLRSDGRHCMHQGPSELEFVSVVKNRYMDRDFDQQLTKDRMESRKGNGHKDNAEGINVRAEGRNKHNTLRNKENKKNLLVSCDSRERSFLEKSNWRALDMEGVFVALDKAEAILSIVNILFLVQKCRESKYTLFSLRLHQHICENGLETDVVVGNYLVPMFVECGDLLSASQLFNKLDHRNEHAWSALVLGYATNGDLQHAVELYHEMDKGGIQPTSYTFVGLLKACASAGNLIVGRDLHELIKQKGFGGDVLVGNTLVDMYIKCGSLGEAEEVFDSLPMRDVVSWTALLTGYVECELGEKALALYHKMQAESISANAVTLALAAKACRIMQALDEGRIIHSEAVQKGYEGDLTVSNSMLSLYSKCGCLDEAREGFDKLQALDVVSWNTLISAYVEHGHFEESFECFVEMQAAEFVPDTTSLSCALKACASLGAVEQGQVVHITSMKLGLAQDLSVANSLIGLYGRCGLLLEARRVFDMLSVRDVVSWTALIAGYAEHGHAEEALLCLICMQECELVPNAITYSCVLKACGAVGVIVEGRELHMEVIKKGFDSEPAAANVLVSMYVACGILEEAFNVFERIPVKCVVSWSSLIGGYADCGSGVSALKCLEQMQAGGIIPNSVTYACTLKACGSIGAIDKGRELHGQIAWDGLERDSSVGSALISMYARCGSLIEACEVFDDLSTYDVSVWSAMMKAYAMNHEGSKAVQCFKDMQQQGCKPDVVTFTCLLTACSHAGLTHEGLEYFKLMRDKYGFAPTREHYSCMVDLLARSGDLFNAEKFLETFAPSCEDTWAALLSACKTHGEVELGFRCFQELMLKDPEDAAWYVLMTDIYTGAGRWADASKIEAHRKQVEAKKKPASAWIEVGKEVHEFVVGGEQDDDVLATVRNLNLHLKDEGHVPNLNRDVRPTSDHEKEVALCEHAEKLAIAFGLLNTPQGTTLRLTKNLRMCADCHSASKVISKMERREIILRDDCCMHHFKDGSCVCGDMF